MGSAVRAFGCTLGVPKLEASLHADGLLVQVVSTSGDTHLGGEDFDHRVMDYFMKLVKRKYKVRTAGSWSLYEAGSAHTATIPADDRPKSCKARETTRHRSFCVQVDISKDNRALQKLRRETERAKRALSSQHQVRICAGSRTACTLVQRRQLWPGCGLDGRSPSCLHT
jgi:Hsp70 protein